MQQLARKISAYQEITVYEAAELYGEKGVFRFLQFSEDAVQGAIDLKDKSRIVLEYPRAIIHLMESNNPKFENMFMIGHGVGSIASHYKEKSVTVAEIDESVVALSRQYFDYQQDNVTIGDGREILNHEESDSFDYIILDAFTTEGTPYHLTTMEFFEMTQRKLKADGSIILNLTGRIKNDKLIEAIYTTLKETYSHTKAFVLPGEDNLDICNIIVVGGNTKIRYEPPAMVGFIELELGGGHMIMDRVPIYRFSESPLWDLQRDYYEERGVHAWQSEEVPLYITNNPTIAKAYAEMIFGVLQDRARLGHTTETVMILELGAGSGRLAFHVLKELCELRDFANMEHPPFCYCISDFARKNIMYWQQHPSLSSFVQQSILDFAHFDAMHDAELHLTESKISVRVSELEQPLIIVANYFFDSIPQELIYVGEDGIYECRVSLHETQEASQLDVANRIDRVTPEYHYHRVPEYEEESYPYYELIKQYSEKLEDSHILIPEIGMACLERLRELSKDGFVLLTADKGDHRLVNWEFAEPPSIIHHGSFSLTANYHAIQTHFEAQGAHSIFTKHHYKNLNVGCILMIPDPISYYNTRLAYRRFIDQFGPDDFFTMKEWFDEYVDQMDLRHILSFWRLGSYDAQLFLQSAKRMLEVLPMSADEEIEDLHIGIECMWEGYYPLGEKSDVALNSGMVLFEMECYEDALKCYERSLNLDDANSATLYQMAICSSELDKDDQARHYAQRAVAIEPAHEGALSLLSVL
ncbi:SAM-dependent methyltransferase [Paenibacillus sp. CMAA1364]